MIKYKVIEELGEEIFSQALEIFLKNANKEVMLLNLYIESKDYLNAKDLSHKLLGTFESIGVKKIPTVLRRIDSALKERFIKKEDLFLFNELYGELKTFIKKEYNIETEV